MLVNPNEFHRLEGIDIDSSRVFIVVSEGCIDINLNGKRCHIESCSCIDSLDTVTIRIEKCEKDARAWCMLVTYTFARNSLKNFKPVRETAADTGHTHTLFHKRSNIASGHTAKFSG